MTKTYACVLSITKKMNFIHTRKLESDVRTIHSAQNRNGKHGSFAALLVYCFQAVTAQR